MGGWRIYNTPQWRQIRAQVKANAKGLCQYELKRNGCYVPGYAVDHIVPLSKGGSEFGGTFTFLSKEAHAIKTASEKHMTVDQIMAEWGVLAVPT
ncbi:HNH endonuclease [Ferrimonas sp.]|uniref:HNH endonuclease n=1 Tax=Ferrimonas sp. TaxID=2080861 RepID=UPI003A9068D6